MDRIVLIFVAVIAVLVFLTLLAQSGALPWAMTGGLLSGGIAFRLLRDWRTSTAAGIAVALVISVIGIGQFLA